MEQGALSKTIMVQDVSIDSTLENNLQDMKYNMSGIKSAIMSEIDSLITQTFAENDITELSIVGRARKHLKVVCICEYEILNYTRRPFEPSNQYLHK